MPTYEFRNKESGEIIERFMSIASKEQFLLDNPHLEQTITRAPSVNADPIGGNQHRRAFKEVLNKIHSSTAGSVMNRTTEL